MLSLPDCQIGLHVFEIISLEISSFVFEIISLEISSFDLIQS